MIKYLKLLLFSFVFVLFWFLNFSDAYVYENMYVRQNSIPWFSPYNSSYDVAGLSKFNFLTQSLGVWKNFFYLWSWTFITRQYNNGVLMPYMSVSNWQWTWRYQGFVMYYWLCDYFSWQHIADYTVTNCNVNSLNANDMEWIKNFINSVTTNDRFAFKLNINNYVNDPNCWQFMYCVSSAEMYRSLCFAGASICHANTRIFSWVVVQARQFTLTWWINIKLPYRFEDIDRSYLYNSPVSSNNNPNNTWSVSNQSWDYVEQEVTDNDLLNYFENTYRFNRSMCYVNTTDLNSEYWTIWQTDWTWQTSIFDMFSHLYNRLPASDWYTIIWRWIDFWLYNYNYWFNYDNPPFLLTGSPLAELRSKIYTWFTSPFIWQPAFVYFYINELFNESADLVVWSERYWPLIAEYCDLKLNWSLQYTWIKKVDNEIKNNKGFHFMWWEDWDQNIEYQNPSWTSGFWENNDYTWTQNINSAFSQFYANLSSLFNWVNVYWSGIIPNYILFFLAFIILVRILKK